MTTTVSAPRSQPAETGLRSLGRVDWSTWPKYEAAVLGFREYWYPVTWSRMVGAKPVPVTILGERILLHRTGGQVRSRAFGDESVLGDAAVRSYPVAERLGLVWIFIGDGDPPPVEADIPSELLAPGTAVCARLTHRSGNWRFGAENGFDEGHAKFLHRKALWVLKRRMPTWVRHHIEPRDEGWIQRVPDEVHFETEFPGLGVWPPHRWWRSKGRGTATVSIRLPCALRVAYATWTHFEWWVPIGVDDHVYLQVVAQPGNRLARIRFWLYYRLWVRWVFHGLFNDEDRLMVDVMDAPPERLYRPDIALTEWRKLCEQTARGRPQQAGPNGLAVTTPAEPG
jgi:phenylpropionate dioxygenase-like ring-hydroxylating dioxygenase large terminal subunit